MNKVQKKSAAKSREDTITYRILLAFTFTVIAIFALTLVKRSFYYAFEMLEVSYSYLIAAKLFALLTLAGAALTVFARRLKWPSSLSTLGIYVTVLGAIAVLSCLYIYIYNISAVKSLFYIYPIASVYFLLYNIYQKEFFYNALLTGAFCLLLYHFGQGIGQIDLIINIAGIVFLAVSALAAYYLKKNKGKIGKLRLLPSEMNYTYAFISCGFLGLCLIAALIGGATVAYYCFFICAVYLFAMAVYYTIKMM